VHTGHVVVPSTEFESVPTAEATAEIDPHWLELRGESPLPTVYMPPSMAGRRGSLIRIVASSLVAIFMLATTLGVCLTYGPPA
jgi:hypothetical protein